MIKLHVRIVGFVNKHVKRKKGSRIPLQVYIYFHPKQINKGKYVQGGQSLDFSSVLVRS